MFIRVKKRQGKKSVNYYAYLVNNKWTRYLPKQKVSLYLGPYFKLEKISNIISDLNKVKKENLFHFILKNELLNHEFKDEGNWLFTHEKGFKVNLKTKSVFNKNKKICLGVNQGYLCNYTLKKLISFKLKTKEDSKNLIKIMIEVGFNPDKDLFIEIFNKILP